MPHLLAFVVFLVISVIYCKPALEGKVVEQHDVQQWKAMAQQPYTYYLKHQHFPYWSNGMFSGMPAYQIAMDSHESLVVNVYYFHHVLTLGLPKPAYYLYFCCLGIYLLCIVIGISPWLSIVGGIAYGYASYNPILITAGHDTKLLSMAYSPAILASVLLLFQKRYWLGGIGLILFTTGLVCQSHQQIAYYTYLMAGALSVPFIVKAVKEKQFAHIGFCLLLGTVCTVVSILYVANSYFPVYEYTQETMRGGGSGLTLGSKGEKKNKTEGGLDKDYAFRWSYGIGETMTLLVPNAFGGGSSTMLAEDGKVMSLLQNTSEIPDQAKQQLLQVASAYWGDQPGTSGPVYLGAFVCMLAIAGFAFSKSEHRWWLLAVTLMGIVLSWGKNLESVNYFLFDHLPFYKKFRAPSMALVMPQLSVVTMALIYANELLKRFLGTTETESEKAENQKQWKNFLMVAGGSVGLLILFYLFAGFSNAATLQMRQNLASALKGNEAFVKSFMAAWIDDRKDLYFKDMARSIGIMLVAAGVFFAVYIKKINYRTAVAALFLLALYDYLPIGKRYFNEDKFVEADSYDQAYKKTPADLQLDNDTSYYRILNLAAFNGNGYTLDVGNSFNDAIASYHHNTIGGYHPAKLSIYNDLIEFQLYKNIQSWGNNPMAKDNFPVLNMLNMKYVVVPNQKDPKQNIALSNPFNLGSCWFVKELKFVKNADEEMLSLDRFDPAKTAFANESFKSSIGTPEFVFDSTASIQLALNDNDYIKYQSKAKTTQFAVFSEIYYGHGWKVYIDGKPSPYIKVNYVLRGMPVPAGEHVIEFKFEPELVKTGELLAKYAGISSVLLVILFGFLQWKEGKKDSI